MKNTIALTALAALPLSLSALAQPANMIQDAQNVSLQGTSTQFNAMDAMEANAFHRCGPHSKACFMEVLGKEEAAQIAIPEAVLAIHSALGA